MPQTLQQFGQTIKQKHPEYGDLPDEEVAQKVLAKYPQYQDMVKQPTGKEQRLALASPGANTFTPVPEATGYEDTSGPTGFLKARANQLNASLDRQDQGQQGPVQTAVQAAGNTVVGPAMDVVGKMLSPITKTADAVLNGGAARVANAVTGQGFTPNPTPDPLQFITNPAYKDTAEAVLNLGQAAASVAGAVKAGPEVGDVLKQAPEAAKQAASGVVDSMAAKQAAKIDEQLGLQKNTSAATAQRKMSSMTGAKTPGQVMVENKIPFDNNAPQALEEHIAVRDAAKQALLQSEGKYASLDDVATQAKANLTMQGTDLVKAQKIIDSELKAYKQQYANQGFKTPDGKLMLPLDQIDSIKSSLWKQSYGKGLTLSDQLTKQAKAQFGDAAKTIIESNTESDLVHNLNRETGDLINAKKLMTDKNITQMKAPGKVATGVRKILGGVVGSHAGLPGAIAGAEIADYVGRMLDQVPDTLRQSIISKLKSTPEGQSVLSKVQDMVKNRAVEKAGQKALPPQSTIFAAGGQQVEPNLGTHSYYDPTPDIQYQNNIKRLPAGTQSPTIFAGPGPDASGSRLLEPSTATARDPKTGRIFKVYRSTPK